MKIYCAGIGGIGLSAYAALQKLNGHEVSGSDRSKSALTDDLESQGIRISFDQSGASLPNETELFVYSEAMPTDAPEQKKAEKQGIRSLSYPAALGELSKDSFVIAVCGSHGKSSTTGMAARMFLECGLSPTIVVGTKLKELNGRNWHKGKDNYFLIEACEYRRSFLQYHPNIILVTNADGDHYDYFKDMHDYRKAFAEFVAKLPNDGSLIIHGNDTEARTIAAQTQASVVDADAFPLLQLQTPGEHMRRNAQLVLALASLFPKISQEEAKKSVSGYAGSWRRLEVKGERTDGVTVIDDYAHHPVEIRASLAALREAYPKRRIVCVFQPHTHDRTIKLYDEFLSSFSDCDELLVTDVYEARKDIETAKVDMNKFIEGITSHSKVKALKAENLSEAEVLLRKEILQPGDVLVCMGAGDITNLAERMMH